MEDLVDANPRHLGKLAARRGKRLFHYELERRVMIERGALTIVVFGRDRHGRRHQGPRP
jgi:hypothetical protein